MLRCCLLFLMASEVLVVFLMPICCYLFLATGWLGWLWAILILVVTREVLGRFTRRKVEAS